MSIRIRLTLLYTIILALLTTIFGVAVYSTQNFYLNREINQSIADVAEQVFSASRAISTGEGQTLIEIPPLDVFRTSNVYTQVWNLNGDLVDHSDNLGRMRESMDPDGLAVDEPVMRDVVIDGVNVRVLTVPIEVDDQIRGYLQVASSLEPLEDARKNLLVIMLVVSGVTILLSALSGYWLADRALRPIKVITRTAEQITQADHLDRRIPYKGPGDELGRLVNTFNATLARLERLFNAQQRLVADVSHELRTPLTSILGNIDLLRRMGDDELSLQAIEDETRRMSRLVDDILLLAKADAGRLPLVEGKVELDTLLVEVYSQARVLSNEGVDVSLTVEDRASVFGDQDRLKQLVLNLVSNAVKYTTAGDTIDLVLRRVEAGPDDPESVPGWAEVRVADSGPGIPAHDLPHIFDRFYRVDRSRARGKNGGAGLGLAIARWIAHAHGGQLSVQSVEGQGATFVLRLPLLAVETEGSSGGIFESLRVPGLQT